MPSSSDIRNKAISNHSDKAATGKRENDSKRYENSGAEHGVPEIRGGYTGINDIDLQIRNKDEEERPYDNNKVEPDCSRTISVSKDFTEESLQKGHDNLADNDYARINEPEDKKRTACRRHICIITIVSMAVLAGSGIGIWRILVSCDRLGNCVLPPDQQRQEQDCLVRRGENVSMYFTIHLVNPRVIRLLKETSYRNETLFIVTNLTNNTMQTVGDNLMNFTFSVKDADIEATVYISITQCLHEGNYYVMAISDNNGSKDKGLKLHVLSECPCRFEFNITSFHDMKCSFPDAGNTSIVVEKTICDNPRILVNWTNIIRPLDLPITNSFSASWLRNGTLVVEIQLGRIDCTHDGYYNINLTMNNTSLMYEVYVHVIDYPKEPQLTVLEGGITKDKDGGQMLCTASTGCTKTPFKLEYYIKGGDQWSSWPSNYGTEFEPDGNMGWYSKSFINITKNTIDTVDRKKFRCIYKANGKTLTSYTLCVRVIPAKYCPNNSSGCNYEHPFFCDKFITCTTVAEERACPAGLHFLYKGLCGGGCKYLTDDYKRNCNGYCDWPSNVNCTKPTNYCD